MGVPLFFGWLRNRYPTIVAPICDVVSDPLPAAAAAVGDGDHEAQHLHTERGVISCAGSEQDLRCDNLYLDMNGIIHQCSHPIDRPAPATEEGEASSSVLMQC